MSSLDANNELSTGSTNTSITTHQSRPQLYYTEFERLKSYALVWRFSLRKGSLAENGFYYVGRDDVCICVFCNIILNVSRYTSGEVNTIHKSISAACDLAHGRATANVPLGLADDYRYELNRLVSFLRVNWEAPVDPYDLARWGFYYYGVADVGRCHYCRLEVRGWEQGDRGESEHRRWNPSCPFLQNRMVGNVPLDQESRENVIEADLTTPFSESTVRDEDVAAVLNMASSRHPAFAQTADRISSFSVWPVSLSQRPSQLAHAGFYYTGRGDRVVCFYCGGGLKDWGPGDEPWVEHAAWFRTCSYVKLIKGEAFIAQVQALRTAQSADEMQPYNQSTVQGDEPTTNTSQETVQAEYQIVSSQQETANSDSETMAASTSEASKHKDNSETNVDEDEAMTVRMCKVCFQKELGIVFLPCGHMVTCPDCAPQLKNCPICRSVANAFVRAYLP